MNKEGKYKLLLYIINKLNKRKNRSGETAIQKLVYLMIVKNKIPLDYEYIIYDYGPWSFDLMEDIKYLEDANATRKNPHQSGMGFQLIPNEDMDFVKENLDTSTRIRTRWDTKIDEIIEDYSGRPAKYLALSTTFLYICQKHKDKSDSDIIELVKEIKPLHNKWEYENTLKDCREILEGS